ncbi:MAG: sigma-E factor negative regulatory protein [Proteobacteria bacterium]|nr:sigma-E factor negative regulatory protein [Pseudomonadota bacterium]
MKETDQELVSRILDEEISEFETRRILKEIQQDPELYSTYQRYNLIGDAMRRQLPSRLNPDFSKEVMGKLSSDPESGTRRPMHWPGNMKIPVGMGIAALLAVFSFVMLQDFIPLTPSSSVAPVEIAEHVTEDEVQDFASSPKAAEDFNSYIVNHAEYASPRVSMPRVRIVSYNRPYSENGNQ